ncbi:MAG: phosphoribosylformylglycinamidine synthase subunit PurL [Pseudomonadota bacterium]
MSAPAPADPAPALPPEPEVTESLAADHGLTPDEYRRLLDLLGRTPSFTELGIASAMWNEHCSYKSSKIHLKKLPTTGPQVICGPGENAGVIDIGEDENGVPLAAVFKMESHNHPSFIEPHQGAATGVGGILRDVFTMGARPMAALNALSFGAPDHPLTPRLLAGVVEGIGSYGNAFGVPTVGGETRFHPAYNGNILVNAMAVGIARQDAIFYSAASGVGRPVVYLGAKTGRDGVGGATMASAEFDDSTAEKRPTVQVGDPFTEKRLLEATLELMATGAVVSIQDMGAAGLTCSAVEMGDKGGLGVALNLDAVPQRETAMTAYEMMLSESQERMLMVLDPALEDQARAVFDKWDLDFAIVGETIPEDRFLVRHRGELKADMPLSALSGAAPEYDRPWEPTPPSPVPQDLPDSENPAEDLAKLLASPNFRSRAWIWEQYDHTVGADTVVGPGADAAVVRVHGTRKALAMTTDVTPRYCLADPVQGGRQAVAEAFRNLCATGAKPLAITDNLNFGNPEKPRIMGQLVGCLQGIGEASKALDMPVVSGNVSLYNETDGASILPTPTIGAVGLLEDASRAAPMAGQEGDALVLIGESRGHLSRSAWLYELHGREEGPPPPVDLDAERRAGELVRSLLASGLARAAHDLSDGGLAVAAAEIALAAGCGVALEDPPEGFSKAEWWFGEDQGRYLACMSSEKAVMLLKIQENSTWIGTLGKSKLRLGSYDLALERLISKHSYIAPT